MNTTIILLILSVFLSGFFSGAEVAIVSMTELKIRHLVERKVKNAKYLLHLKLNPSKTLITILIGNNVVNIGGSALATKLAIDMFDSAGVGIATGAMTFLILSFGEIIPKTFASKNAKNVSLAIAPFVLFLMRLLTPLVYFFFGMSKAFNRLGGSSVLEPLVTEQEVRDIVSLGEEVGEIKTREKEMIHRVFKFDDTDVESIMTPTTELFALDWNMSLEEALPIISENEFSRIPVYDQRLDKIKGVVLTRDMLKLKNVDLSKKLLKDIMQEPYFVPEHQKIDKLLRHLQKKKFHMAIVVDEHGGVEGVVTIEDILEELVGDIFDEHDEVERFIRSAGQNKWLVLGKTPIEDINEELSLQFSELEDYSTIAGLIQDEMGRVPKSGEEFTSKKLKVHITIKKMEGPVIVEVLLEKI